MVKSRVTSSDVDAGPGASRLCSIVPPGFICSGVLGRTKQNLKGVSRMENMVSLEGPVFEMDGQLMLLVPLESASAEVIEKNRGMAEVCGEFLKIVIPDWLAGVLWIEEGDMVSIQSSNGDFQFHPKSAEKVN
jgi:hypothetical protein